MRIAITGMGIVTPVGRSVPAFWDAVCRGESAIRPLTRFDTQGFACTRGGEIQGFQLPAALSAHAGRDLATQFMLAAAAEALQDAGLATAGTAAQSGIGVVLSTNFGATPASEEVYAAAVGRGTLTEAAAREAVFQACADAVATQWALGGPRSMLSLSCASGTAALVHAVDLIRAGRAQAVLAGGYDCLSRFCWSGLSVLRTMAKDVVRPFDKNRAGTLFSEGAGALILEDYELAKARGAHIYAEYAGGATNNNAFHLTAPAKEGAGSAAVMRLALEDAGLPPEAVGHINAHGTGTQPNDVTETQAIKAVFGVHAVRIPLTSIKSSVGHLMGAAGSAEAIASVLTLCDGLIPPTTNYQTPDPECDLPLVANFAQRTDATVVLSNSAGIGGCNAAVVFRKPAPRSG